MKFEEFLITEINKQLPIDKLKQDLSYFKNAFNYASKTDTLYNNLIDNIVFILQRKFNRFDIIYKNSEVMYNELLLTLSPQIPQFLMIQKKQLLESLDTFADLNNWGEVLKDNIKRDLNLSSSGENTTNFLPIDGTEKDPYSTNDVQSNETQGENTNVNRNVANYLDFYENITWNIADLELEKILKPYYKMFKLYYATQPSEQVGGGGVDYSELEKRVENLEQTTEVIINEVEQNMEKIDNNTASIEDNKNQIDSNKTQIDANKEQIEQIDQELNTFAKLGLDNNFTATNTFNNQTNFKNKTTFMGIGSNDGKKVELSNFDYQNKNYSALKFVKDSNNMLQIEVNNTDNQATISCPTGNILNILNLEEPTVDHQAASKIYVDNLVKGITVGELTNYYTKQETDAKFGLKSIQETNSTNIVNLENTKANKTDIYTKTESDNRYANKTSENTFTQTNKFARIVEMGTTGGEAYLLPQKTTGTTNLKIGNSPNNNDKRFNLDLENRSQIINVPNPLNDYDVSTKYYVDENRRVVELKLTNDYYTKTVSDQKYGLINGWNEWQQTNTFQGTTYFNRPPYCQFHYDESYDWFTLVNKEYVNNWMKYDWIQKADIQWMSTYEDYGWTYMCRITKRLKMKKIFGCSIQWKPNAGNTYRRQCVANVWYDGSDWYVSFILSATAKPDPYNNLLDAIQIIYIIGQ